MKNLLFVLLAVMFFDCSKDQKEADNVVLHPATKLTTDLKINPDDYFTVVSEVDKIGLLTRIAVKRSSDGFLFSAFWEDTTKFYTGQKVNLTCYDFNFSSGGRSFVAIAHPN